MKWQIYSAVALRKLPEIRPKLDPIHAKVQNVFSAFEVAQSKLSNHELEHLEDIRDKGGEVEDLEILVKETARDKEDKWIKAREEFSPAAYNDRLSRVQYLFINSKSEINPEGQWLLPQALYDSNQDESLLDTARRALREQLDIVNGFRIVSKIPSAVYTNKYSKNFANFEGILGQKIFFLKAHLDLPSRSVLDKLNDTTNDNLKWLTQDEFVTLVKRKTYQSALRTGLLSEDRVDTDEVLKRAANYISAIRSKHQMQQ